MNCFCYLWRCELFVFAGTFGDVNFCFFAGTFSNVNCFCWYFWRCALFVFAGTFGDVNCLFLLVPMLVYTVLNNV